MYLLNLWYTYIRKSKFYPPIPHKLFHIHSSHLFHSYIVCMLSESSRTFSFASPSSDAMWQKVFFLCSPFFLFLKKSILKYMPALGFFIHMLCNWCGVGVCLKLHVHIYVCTWVCMLELSCSKVAQTAASTHSIAGSVIILGRILCGKLLSHFTSRMFREFSFEFPFEFIAIWFNAVELRLWHYSCVADVLQI